MWRFVQTDPNRGEFFGTTLETGTTYLIGFGSPLSSTTGRLWMDIRLRIVWAAYHGIDSLIWISHLNMGF